MRLHDLSVTAFGPFVDTVRVDFDELSAGGLFLLTGDTGSGKSSVLDAVCFALYGEVPGDRHTAKHLRSDHADATAQPLVVLRLSIRGRTLRFTRSPAWDRPKRRGTGTTRVQAHVVVEEQRGGEWVALTNRLDEAGHLVTDLLGMTCTQFTQVAMLPQGRFQAFLRASSAERQAVLQRLFRTRRFEDVERWLVDRRVVLRRESRSFHDRAAGVVNRLQEAAGVGVPADWQLDDLDPVVADGALLGWADGVGDDARAAASLREADLLAATERVAHERTTLDRSRALAESRRRGEQAARSLAELDESADVERDLLDSLDAHRRAGPVLPMTVRAENAADAASEAAEAAAPPLERAGRLLQTSPEDLDTEILARAATRSGEARAVAEAWLPRERDLLDERNRVRSLSAAISGLEAGLRANSAETDELTGAQTSCGEQLTHLRDLAGRRPADGVAVEAASLALAAATQAAALDVRLADSRTRLETATQHTQDLRETYQDLREQRISGMAAELAGTLAAGCSCPVCGSAVHPSPARASGSVSRSDEEAARGRYESADFERQTLVEAVTTLRAQLTAARERCDGLATDHWTEVRREAGSALAESSAAAERLEVVQREAAELDTRLRSLATERTSLAVSLDERLHTLEDTRGRADQLAAELADLLADSGSPSVTALLERHAAAVDLLDDAREALTARDRTARDLQQATEVARSAATEARFESVEDAVAAVLTGHEASSRATRLEERRTARATAEGVLHEEAVAAALTTVAPDLAAVAQGVAEAEAARDATQAAHRLASTRCTRLQTLRAELDDVLATWEPVRRRHDLTAGLTALVEGKSADNQLKMRLSAYVLSERLRQVVASANERLGTMTDQRYTLDQTDAKGAGEQRGGLSLLVRDEWSGKQRDPATLSGGETFLVSLALALGLADTVSHEAGGTQLDTLFIDEGFGALDATTLDAVMDTLDSLRDGGRVVGLVSHVAELRNRVPAQLEVRKARRGSTLTPCLATG